MMKFMMKKMMPMMSGNIEKMNISDKNEMMDKNDASYDGKSKV
jgi:hypothetical protein